MKTEIQPVQSKEPTPVKNEQKKVEQLPCEVILSEDASLLEKRAAADRLIWNNEEVEKMRNRAAYLGFPVDSPRIENSGFFTDLTVFTVDLLSEEELEKLRAIEAEAQALRAELDDAHNVPRAVSSAIHRMDQDAALDSRQRNEAALGVMMRRSTIQALKNIADEMNARNRCFFCEIDRRIAARLLDELKRVVANERKLWEQVNSLEEPGDEVGFVPSKRLFRIANTAVSLTMGVLPVSAPVLPSEFFEGKIVF